MIQELREKMKRDTSNLLRPLSSLQREESQPLEKREGKKRSKEKTYRDLEKQKHIPEKEQCLANSSNLRFFYI